MLFSGWDGLVRVLVVGVLAYASLVVLLRVSGKRTLSKLNAFDLVVTVALGSTLATVLLSKEVALAEGITAFALLIALQFAITWSSVRWGPVRRLVKAEPALLVHRGELLREAMRRERVTEDEVRAAAREHGAGELDKVAEAVIETDGTISVMRMSDASPPAADSAGPSTHRMAAQRARTSRADTRMRTTHRPRRRGLGPPRRLPGSGELARLRTAGSGGCPDGAREPRP